MTKAAVLVVDDNDRLRRIVCESLEAEGYLVFAAANGKEAVDAIQAQSIDALVLDIVLPDEDGLSLIARIRKTSDAPVILVSGKNAWVDKVIGLEMGADDYLGKPFEMKELCARVKANVRRYRSGGREAETRAATPAPIMFDRWTLDPAKFQAFDNEGASADLTVMEFRLLQALAETPNCVLSREQILARARADSLAVFDRAVDIQITRIRRKIGDDARSPRIIKTVRGAGYMFACKTVISH